MKLAQSIAIMAYVSNWLDLMPRSEEYRTIATEICLAVDDATNEMYRNKDDKSKQKEILKDILEKLEKRFKDGGDYFDGILSFADVSVYDLIQQSTEKLEDVDLEAWNLPKLKNMYEKIQQKVLQSKE